MEQIYLMVGNYLLSHPQLLAFIVAYLAAVKVITVVVDALVSSRAEWDKSPLTDDTWYEKAFTFVVRTVGFMGKIAAHLSGFRPKPKAETIIEAEKK
jgi:hypothetical protein